LNLTYLVALSALLSNPTEVTARLLKAAAERDAPARQELARNMPAGQFQRRLATDEIDALARAYEAGASVRKLSADFGIHKESVRACLDRTGVPRREGCVAKLDDAGELTAGRLYQQGSSLSAVGTQLGVTDNTVLKALRKHGVPTRRPGRQAT
jgi:lambda repressor-like predicted transcriptional regulator